MHTVILGGGVTGLAAAYELNRPGNRTYAVFEAEDRIGGLCQTLRVDGFTFDAVSHVLHFRSPEARELVLRLLDGNLKAHRRIARVQFRGRQVPYPFQAHLGFLPFREKTSCVLNYLRARLANSNGFGAEPETFEEWIRKHFGNGIAELFMVPYNTKLWGIHPSALSTDWVRWFVPRSNVRQAILSFIQRDTDDLGYNSTFYYPTTGGIQALVEALARELPPVHLRQRAVGLDLRRKVIRFENGRQVSYERLISTIPLRSLILQISDCPEEARALAEGLRCTSLLSIAYCLKQPVPHPHHWVYFPESEFPFFRLVFPSNICAGLAPRNCSIISAEISNPDPENLERVEADVRQCLLQLGLVRSEAEILHTIPRFIPHAYPVHDLARATRVKKLLSFLEERDVISVGRFGAWRYSSIDDALMEGLRAARAHSGETDACRTGEVLV